MHKRNILLTFNTQDLIVKSPLLASDQDNNFYLIIFNILITCL